MLRNCVLSPLVAISNQPRNVCFQPFFFPEPNLHLSIPPFSIHSLIFLYSSHRESRINVTLSLSLSDLKKRKIKELGRNIFHWTSFYYYLIASRRRRRKKLQGITRETKSKKGDQRIGWIASPAYRGRWFSHPAVASIHRLHFSFRGYCRAQSRMQVKATELAPRYEVAVLHSEAKRTRPSTALLHFSPLSPARGHRPIHEIHHFVMQMFRNNNFIPTRLSPPTVLNVLPVRARACSLGWERGKKKEKRRRRGKRERTSAFVPRKAGKRENKNLWTACGEPLPCEPLSHATDWCIIVNDARAKSKVHSSGEILRLLFF